MEDDLKGDIAEFKREIGMIKASVGRVTLLAWTTLAFLIGTILSTVI